MMACLRWMNPPSLVKMLYELEARGYRANFDEYKDH